METCRASFLPALPLGCAPPPLSPEFSNHRDPIHNVPQITRSRRHAGFPVTDALVNDSFDGVYRRGQAGVNSALQAVQGRLKVAHSVASGIVMLLVKGSVEVRLGCRTFVWDMGWSTVVL